MDIWSLIQQGKFEEACEKSDIEFEKTKNLYILRNKVYALFLLQDYDEVINTTKKIIENRGGETDSDFIFLGIAYWITGNKSLAIQTWRNAEKCKYTDAAGGIELQIILYFASVNLNDLALKKRVLKAIEKKIKSKASVNWPGPLGTFILGQVSKEELLSFISETPILKERQLCQAYFVIAILR